MSGPEPHVEHGRHRRGRPWWLLPLVALLALGIGYGAGLLAGRGTGQAPTDTASPTTVPLTPVTELPTAGVRPSGASAAPGVPAPADPSNAESGEVSSFLAALDRAQVPIGSNRDVVLAIGRQVCQQPPERRADPTGQAAQIVAVFPGLWNPTQAQAIVRSADESFC